MIEIAPGDPGSAEPWRNLLPVVELLLAHGNRYVPGREGFIEDPHGGAECDLELPLDFDLLAAEVTFPDTVEVGPPEADGILDRGTWCVISGPGERASRIVMPKRID
ncbi:hypothetical protein ACFYW6_33995 [Streptomyces sp. NPDC002659]|uniref:hypothetical protein n=1 Tax=Streptomyces sp. NPDC002659 TaxID=3364656 RepID=UPI0036AAFDE8